MIDNRGEPTISFDLLVKIGCMLPIKDFLSFMMICRSIYRKFTSTSTANVSFWKSRYELISSPKEGNNAYSNPNETRKSLIAATRQLCADLGHPGDPNNALLAAVEAGAFDKAIHLVHLGADPNTRNKDGSYVLGCAVLNLNNANNPAKLVKVLLEYGADANAQAPDGTTGIILACGNDDFESVVLLLKAGADPNLHLHDDEYPEINGETALMNAVGNGENIEIVKLLLQAKADPRAVKEDGKSVLSYAQESGNAEMISLIETAIEAINSKSLSR